MPASLPWLKGLRLVGAAKQDYTWSFSFSDGASISTESAWRLITPGGVHVAADDDGQCFGLPAPVSASARVLAATDGKKVERCRLVDRTGDLIVDFEGTVTLEFLTLSCGFESWHARYGAEEIVCMGGGEVAFFSGEKRG